MRPHGARSAHPPQTWAGAGGWTLGLTVKHVYPRIGDKPIATVLLSDLQALVKAMSLDLSPASVGVVYRITAAVFMRQVRCSASRSTASTS